MSRACIILLAASHLCIGTAVTVHQLRLEARQSPAIPPSPVANAPPPKEAPAPKPATATAPATNQPPAAQAPAQPEAAPPATDQPPAAQAPAQPEAAPLQQPSANVPVQPQAPAATGGAAPGDGGGMPPATKAQIVVGTMIWLTFVALGTTAVAYYYKQKKGRSAYVRGDDFNTYKTGLFDCFEDLPLCCLTINCPGIRWADTMSSVGAEQNGLSKVPILNYWKAFVGFLILGLLSDSFAKFGGIIIGWVAFACLLAHFRQRFRDAFNMEHDNKTLGLDCLKACFCFPCFIAQDARHVEEAKKHNHRAVIA